MTFIVVYSCDENYLEHFYISAHSLELSGNKDVKIHLLYNGCRKSKKLELIKKYLCEKLSIYYPDENLFSNAKVDKNIPVAAYSRLLIAKYVFDVERVLYLDCDTIVTGSITDIFNTDLNGYAIAAVEDAGISLAVKDKLGVGSYFNSGVMLINLREFSKYESKLLQLISRHEIITFHDQCVLNYIFKDIWVPLDRRWNFMSNNFNNVTGFVFDFRILHYNSIYGKPWERNCTHPFKGYYLFVKSLTIFSESSLINGRLIVFLRNKYKFIDNVLKYIRRV